VSAKESEQRTSATMTFGTTSASFWLRVVGVMGVGKNKAKARFGKVKHTIEKVTQYKSPKGFVPISAKTQKAVNEIRALREEIVADRDRSTVATLTPAEQGIVQARRQAEYAAIAAFPANVGAVQTFLQACGTADVIQRLADIGVSQRYLTQGGDLAHDIGTNMQYQIRPIGGGLYPSMKDYFSQGNAAIATRIDSFVRNEKNIRDVFETFHAETIPRRLRTPAELAALTAELIGLGCDNIVLDAQFGNLFTEGFGAGMNLLEGAVFHCDGASKVSTAAARGGTVQTIDPTTFEVPFFIGRSRHLFNHRVLPNGSAINEIHVFPDGDSAVGFTLVCPRGFSVNALCAAGGLDGSRGSGEAGQPVAIQSTYAGADYGNQIILNKTITDWSEFIYSLTAGPNGRMKVLITNDFFLWKLALAAGIDFIIRTVSTSSRYIEVYVNPAVLVLRADQKDTINDRLDAGVNRGPVLARIVALQAAFNESIADVNLPESLQLYINGQFAEMTAKINGIAQTIEDIAARDRADSDLNKVRGLLTQTSDDYLDATFDELRSTLYNTINNYISRLQLKKLQIKSLFITRTDAVTVPDFLTAVKALDLPPPAGGGAAGGGGGDLGAMNVLNGIRLGVDIQKSAKDLIAASAPGMFGGAAYAPVRGSASWNIDNDIDWVDVLNPRTYLGGGGSYVQTGGGEAEVLARAKETQPSHSKGFTTYGIDEYFDVLRDEPDREIRFAALFKIMKAIANEMDETKMWPWFGAAYYRFVTSIIEDAGEGETSVPVMSDVPVRKIVAMMTNDTYGEVFFNVMSRTEEKPQMQLVVSFLEDCIENPFLLPPYAAVDAYCDDSLMVVEAPRPPTGPTKTVIGPNGTIIRVPVNTTRKTGPGYNRPMTFTNLPKEQTPSTGSYLLATSTTAPVTGGRIRGGARRRRTRRRGSRAAARRARTFRRRK
jgi:hypothetical protein